MNKDIKNNLTELENLINNEGLETALLDNTKVVFIYAEKDIDQYTIYDIETIHGRIEFEYDNELEVVTNIYYL